MSLRPEYARWFELLTTREDLTLTLETLASTGSIQLEIHSESHPEISLENLQARMQAYHQLARRYQPYWPQGPLQTANGSGIPGRRLERALQSLLAWERAALPLIHRIESLTSEQTDLALLETLLTHLPDGTLDPGLLQGRGGALASGIFVLPPGLALERLPAGILSTRVDAGTHEFLLAIGTTGQLDTLAAELAGFKAHTLHLPATLADAGDVSLERLRQRQADNAGRLHQLQRQVADLAVPHGLPQALADIRRLAWFLDNVTSLPVSRNFTWVTGWTSDPDGSRLLQALQASGANAVIHFPATPGELVPPVVMRNPRWAKPFEVFARMLGTPSRDEADPSRLLALIAPLLFGYMFGDVGQGLVLMLAGWLLARRWPLLRILVVNGFAAVVFGLVFGSVFGREDIIPALWIHPVEQPLPVLMVPLAGGIVIILLGLLLNALGAYWRGAIRGWLQVDAAVALLYLSIIASLFVPQAPLVALAALAWYFAGSMLRSGHAAAAALLPAAGHLLETVLQMLINTVSFVRVGAFALAHGGLSLAFNTMAGAVDSLAAGLLILVLGNLVVIGLEGLVVSIQTTRLILFEFFIRFLTGSGRSFQPLAAPAIDPGMRRVM